MEINVIQKRGRRMERLVRGKIRGKSGGPGNKFVFKGQAVMPPEFEGQGRWRVGTEVRVGV